MKNESLEESIIAIVKEIKPNEILNQNYIYGYTDAGMMSTLQYGGLAFLDMAYYYLVFAEDELLLLEVSMGGELTGNYGNIPYNDIESFRAKKGLLQYVLTFKLAGEKKLLKIKCNHKMLNAERLGMGWQKGNIANMVDKNWNGLV